MIRSLAVLALAYALFACGDVQDQEEPKILPPLTTLSPPSNAYFLADPACQNTGSNRFPLDRGIIYQFGPLGSGGTGLIASTVSLGTEGLSASPVLKSAHVTHTAVGGVYTRGCDNPLTDSRLCLRGGTNPGWSQVSSSTPLKVCAASSQYPRDSFEGIALTSLYYLERSLKYHEEALGDKLPSVTLEVLPRYESIYQNEFTDDGQRVRVKTFFTHNLAYFPRLAKIVVFPESEQSHAFYAEAGHLWESPFGIAHEAAHHLEQAIAESNNLEWRTSWDPIEHMHQLNNHGFASSGHELARASARSAFSEGFADLAALWSINGEDRWIESLYKLGINRNPTSTHFTVNNRNEAKILSREAVRQLLKEPCGNNSCPFSFNLTAHDTGAILAHAVYRQFMLVAEHAGKTRFSTAEYKDLARFTISWFEATLLAWNAQNLQQANGEDVFNALTHGLERAINLAIRTWQVPPTRQAELRHKACQLGQQLIPALDQPLFSTAGQCPSP